MESVRSKDDYDHDLDFKIEIGGDEEGGKMESMGSGGSKLAGPGAQGSANQPSDQASVGGMNEQFVPRFLQGAAHPGYCMLHLGFKVAALVCYLILGLLIDDKTFCFLIVIILSAIDFWLVKNVTGRILVGLRWWSNIDENGKETWYFESMGENRQTNKVDSFVFWAGSYAVPLLWVLFAVTSVISLKFNQMTICIIGCGLAGINLMGYIRCEKNHKAHVKGFLMNTAKKNISQEQMAKVGQMAAKEALKGQGGKI